MSKPERAAPDRQDPIPASYLRVLRPIAQYSRRAPTMGLSLPDDLLRSLGWVRGDRIVVSRSKAGNLILKRAFITTD